MDDLNIDFNKILEEDPGFKEYAKSVVFDTFVPFNPQLLSTTWAMYQSQMSHESAVFTLKMMIKYNQGGNQNGQTGNHSQS